MEPVSAAPHRECAAAPSRSRRLLVAGLVAAVVFPLALAVRWSWAAIPDGPQFRPRPDALEYAAAAQSIAQGCRYYLQVGPLRVRPRYPPGWPLLLAAALRLGVPGDGLWRVTGAAGAALASLLALVAGLAVSRLRHGDSGRVAAGMAGLAGAAGAGLVVGIGWALAPLALSAGRVVLSDEPAALAAALLMLGTALAVMSHQRPGLSSRAGEAPARGRAAAALGGAAFGLLAGMRPVSAALFAPAVCVLACRGWRALDRREAGRRAAAWAGGAAIVPLLIVALLWRSHLSPWRWTGYEFWVPRWYQDIYSTFNLRYALHGNDELSSDVPNGWRFVKILLGSPGLEPSAYFGLYWPALGWLAAAAFLWRHRQRRWIVAVALAAATAVAAHLVLFSLYFFVSPRFMIAPLMVPLLALGIVLGLGISHPLLRVRLGACLASLALVAAMLGTFLAYRSGPVIAFPDDGVRSSFVAWSQLPDAARAATTMPFDPLQAQALGLLPPATVERIHAWGNLPATVHVKRLRSLGLLPAAPPRPAGKQR
jgi:hypothetical protein